MLFDNIFIFLLLFSHFQCPYLYSLTNFIYLRIIFNMYALPKQIETFLRDAGVWSVSSSSYSGSVSMHTLTAWGSFSAKLL